MTAAPDRRTRKRLATRQSISDAATRLFLERGFDRVTIDEIAEAADVGRMTVFTHFPRKEDMFFDEDQAIREVVFASIADRDPSVSPIEALRGWVHRIAVGDDRYLRFSEASLRFIQTVADSETLRARARAIRDEVARDLTRTLAESVGRSEEDPEAALAAGLVTAAVSVAFLKVHEVFRRDGDENAARSLFLAIVDRGLRGVASAMDGTPYIAGR